MFVVLVSVSTGNASFEIPVHLDSFNSDDVGLFILTSSEFSI